MLVFVLGGFVIRPTEAKKCSFCYFLSAATGIAYLFCSISFGGERNGTQRKAADGPARLKINVVH